MTTVDSIVVERKPGPSGWVYEVHVKGIHPENFGLDCLDDNPEFTSRATGTVLKIIFDNQEGASNVLKFPSLYGFTTLHEAGAPVQLPMEAWED